MLSVDLKDGKLFLNNEIKSTVASKQPYAKWVDGSIIQLKKGSFKRGFIEII